MKVLVALLGCLLSPTLSGALAHGHAPGTWQRSPQPTVTIDSPENGDATNANQISVVVAFEAWVDPKTGDVGNVMDIDLLLNGEILETIRNRPQIKQGSVTFEVDLSQLGDQQLTLVAHAYQGNRIAMHRGVSQEVPVFLDRTAPIISIQWPPTQVFGTDRESIEIEGTTSDSLSGVQQALIESESGQEVLSQPDFFTVQALDTAAPTGGMTVNDFVVRVMDRAGNSMQTSLQVLYTLQTTIAPVDIESVVEVEGVFVSSTQAFVIFEEETPGAMRHEVVERYGGRVAGVLDALDTALVTFGDCESVEELTSILETIMANEGIDDDAPERVVEDVQLDYFLPKNQSSLDNDSLSSGFRVAYDNVRSSEAIRWIESNIAPEDLRPVTVAILDDGLEPSEGLNNEFAGMSFIDATPFGVLASLGFVIDGLLPFSEPYSLGNHGTNVASIIAGRNNGAGNNGVATILAGPQVDVIAYQTFVDPFIPFIPDHADPHALAVAANDIAKRELEVANVSLGLQAPPFLTFGFSRGLWRRIFSKTPNTAWVISAGNDSTEVDRDADCDIFCQIEIPTVLSSEFRNVIAVAAHCPAPTGSPEEPCATDELTSFSNFDNEGISVQISAPGIFVRSAPGGSTSGYGFFSGTSAAAPMVAGAAALMRSVSDIPATEIKDILIQTGRPTPPSNPHPALDVLESVLLAEAISGFQIASGFDVNGSDSDNWETALPREPGLNAFSFDFVSADHHIDVVRVRTDATGAQVAFEDKNADDRYNWFVKGVALPEGSLRFSVPSAGLNTDGGGCDSSGPLLGSGMGVFVLTGFEFRFSDDDHHIDRIRIRFFEPTPGETHVEVCYDDQNDDDDFLWRVDYAVVPAINVLIQGSTPTIFVDPAQNDVNTEMFDLGLSLPPGLPVIRGFGFDLVSDDQHLDRLQVDISSLGIIHVLFRDKSAGGIFGTNDEYEWFVDWAIVQ